MSETVCIPAALLDYQLPPTELALYVELTFLAGGVGRTVSCGLRAVAERRNQGPSTIRSAGRRLVELGLLEMSTSINEKGAVSPTLWKVLPPLDHVPAAEKEKP